MKNLTWYNKIGFFSNPFSIKPAAFHNELFGHNQTIKKVNEKIENSKVVFLSGNYGTGKTTVLKGIIRNFKQGKFEGKNVIYYNCNQSEKPIDYYRLLVNAGGFLRRLFRIRKKNMIILLDEIQDMNKKDMTQLKKYYTDGFFRAIVLVSKYDDVELTDELKSVIGKNKFKLENMSKNEAIKMIRKRIGDLKFISNDMIIKIFNKNENSRSFLKNCEDVCRHAFSEGDELIDECHIREALD